MKRYSIGAAAGCAMMLGHAATAQEKLGIAVCDEFVTKYDACMKDKPADMKKTVVHAEIARQISYWRSKAADPQVKVTIESRCRLTVASFATTLTYPPNNCEM